MTGTAIVDDGVVIRTLARRDMLVLIDDCHHDERAARTVVERLLADGDLASIIVTTRTPITGLRESALTLDPLDPSTDGLQLLHELLGEEVGSAERDHSSLEALALIAGGLPSATEIAAAAVRVGAAGGEEAWQRIETTIMDATTATLVEDVSAGLPTEALSLVRRLACFPSGLRLDEILEFVDPTVGPVTALDALSYLTSAGVVAADPTVYRVTPVLAARLKQSQPEGDARAVLRWAAVRYGRNPTDIVPANASAVLHGLIELGEFDAAMRLIASLGGTWWHGIDRIPFANLCRSLLETPDLTVGRDLEATLFFATHGALDLGDEAHALGYAARYANVAASLDDPSVQMHSWQLKGNVDAYAGALRDARAAYEDALGIARRINHPEATWLAASRATADVLLGNVDAAGRGADEVAVEAKVHHQPRGQAIAAELRGSGAFLQGDLATALAHFGGARRIAASCGAARDEIVALHRIAEAHTCLGDLDEAEQVIASAVLLAKGSGLPTPPPLLAAAAVIASDRGDETEALSKLADLRGSLEYRRPAVWIHRALLAAAIVASVNGRSTEGRVRWAALDDLEHRTGIVLPVPWRERVDRIREAMDDADDRTDWSHRAQSTDPVELISLV
jgi:tetratricopeptide (TPR) repeat protein